MIILLFLLFLIIINLQIIIATKGNFVIVNLDEKTFSNNFSLLSKNLSNFAEDSIAKYEFVDIINVSDGIKDIPIEQKVNMELFEKTSILINSISFSSNNRELTNYNITSHISPEIIPNNYYDGHNSSESEFFADCIYENVLPTFNYTFLPYNVSSIISGVSNFWINDNDSDIYFVRITSDFHISINKLLNKSSQFVKFEKLFKPKPHYYYNEKKILLFAVTSNKSIYIYQYNEENLPNVSELGNITIFQKNTIINEISYNNISIFIATSDGIHIFNKTSLQSIKNIYSKSNIMDIIVNNNSLYLIKEEEGMFIYNFNTDQQYIILGHKYLAKFDHMLYNSKEASSTYFVGIAISNNPEDGVNEILIELVASGQYELKPRINKVFLTQQKINVANIVTDLNSYMSYIFDNNKTLYLLIRGTPNFQETFHYKIDLSDSLKEGEIFEPENIFLINDDNETTYGHLGIKQKANLYIFSEMRTNTQVLNCLFYKKFKFNITFETGIDCSQLVRMEQYMI